MAIKVAFIGAGSVGFTRTLTRDLLTVPEFADTHFAFHDISKPNLDMVAQICAKEIAANNLPATIDATLDRRRAVADADYVINCTRIGGLEAFALDIDIPLAYGVDQCVGDTLCAGGIMYGQRNIPQIQAFTKDIHDLAKDNALFLNYANPMAMNTWSALDSKDSGQGVETVGLCHGVEGGWRQIAAVLMGPGKRNAKGREWALEAQERVQIICAGINHQTWYTKILFDGREVASDELLAGFLKHDHMSKNEKVRIDVLKRFGYYSTESNGHLSEYVPWYRKRPNEIMKWIDLSSWINGETGGYLRVCTEGRNWFESDFPRWLAEAGKPITREQRSGEHGSYIIEARQTGRPYRGHFNVRNLGTITNLPDDCIIEAPGYVDQFGIHMTPVGDLPLACAATCQASVNVQRMAKEAAARGDATLLKQAMLHDPLVGAVCNPEEIWQMTDRMLVAQSQWLPQYVATGAVAAARKALAGAKNLGTNKAHGAARLKIKTIAQLRKAKAASVMAADKAAAQRAKVQNKSK